MRYDYDCILPTDREMHVYEIQIVCTFAKSVVVARGVVCRNNYTTRNLIFIHAPTQTIYMPLILYIFFKNWNTVPLEKGSSNACICMYQLYGWYAGWMDVGITSVLCNVMYCVICGVDVGCCCSVHERERYCRFNCTLYEYVGEVSLRISVRVMCSQRIVLKRLI